MASPFTDDEKRFVLAEILKDSKTDVRPLVDFVKAHCATWNWLSVQVPTGRTINQCIQTTEDMLQGPVPARNPTREPRPAPPAPAPPPAPQYADASAPSIQTLLSGPAHTPRAATPLHVAIQPRPALNSAPHPAEPPSKRRRGRPSRQGNLRSGGRGSPRTLQRLAPAPEAPELERCQGQVQAQVQVQVQGPARGQGVAGARAGSKTSTSSPSPSRCGGEAGPRGRKRGLPLDEMVIKTEGNGMTPTPTPPEVSRDSPPAGSPDADGRDCAGTPPRRGQQRQHPHPHQHPHQHQHQHGVLEKTPQAGRGPLGARVPVTS